MMYCTSEKNGWITATRAWIGWILVLAAILIGSMVRADTISPATYSATLNEGQSVTISKIVTIEAGTPGTALIDIYFVIDNTGSMGGPASSFFSNISDVVDETSLLGDVAWAVGKFEDVPTPPWGGPADVAWTEVQPLTTDQALVKAVSFPLAYGGDGPEANLIALEAAAQNTAWRPNSARYIVYLTDAPGHDPDTTPGYPGPTLQETIDALVAHNIKVLAFATGGIPQAQAIVDATGGSLDTDSLSNWAPRIPPAVEEAASTYNAVTLVSNNPAGVDVDIQPVGHPAGPYDRSVDRTFNFEVTFTGVTTGTYNFTIDALVDGGLVAIETDNITVRGAGAGGGSSVTPVPVDNPLALLLLGLAVLLLAYRRQRHH